MRQPLPVEGSAHNTKRMIPQTVSAHVHEAKLKRARKHRRARNERIISCGVKRRHCRHRCD
eukprot:2792237-Amphidinium_carterae.1